MPRALALFALFSVAGAAHAAPSITWSGSADAYFAYDSARPQNQIVSGLTTGTRDVSPTVNLVLLGLAVETGGFHLHLSAGAGAALDALYSAALPTQSQPSEWRYLIEAWVGYTLPIGRGLTIDAGLVPSHIGFEKFPTVDNWSYSHSWMAELVPRYQVGARVSYPVSEHVSAQLLWLNGWGLVERDHAFRSAGAQLRWSSAKLVALLNLFVGPRPDSDGERFFGDVWASIAPTGWLRAAAAFDLGVDRKSAGVSTWYGAATYLRVEPWRRLAVTLRADLLDDRDGGAITLAAQRLVSATLTIDHAVGALTLRLEGRIDHSTQGLLDGRDERGLLIAAATGRF